LELLLQYRRQLHNCSLSPSIFVVREFLDNAEKIAILLDTQNASAGGERRCPNAHTNVG